MGASLNPLLPLLLFAKGIIPDCCIINNWTIIPFAGQTIGKRIKIFLTVFDCQLQGKFKWRIGQMQDFPCDER
jgi:hypothetical protein